MYLFKIESFYLSSFWIKRYFKRIKESNKRNELFKIRYAVIDTIRNLKINIIEDNLNLDAKAFLTTIELNDNKFIWKEDPEYLENTLIHEIGHLLYLHPYFKQVVELNKEVLSTMIYNEVKYKKSPSPLLSKMDPYYKYISDFNEIRLRIIPLVKYMYDNNISAELTYDRYCKYDDIFEFYSKEQIVYWINNIL